MEITFVGQNTVIAINLIADSQPLFWKSSYYMIYKGEKNIFPNVKYNFKTIMWQEYVSASSVVVILFINY